MFNEKEYNAVFSKVTASAETHRRILSMEYEENRRVTFSFRKGVAILVMIMLLMTLSVTAVAAVTGAEWFENYFREWNGSTLSESQNAYIEKNTVDYSQSMTHNGYTVTVEYALSDGSALYMNVKLTAPEGVVLNADDYGFVYQNKSQFYPVDGSNPSRTGSWHMVNEDPTDNVVYFPMKWQGSGLNIGSKWILELTDLYEAYVREDGFYDDTVIAEGVWRFEITIEGAGEQEVELMQSPLPYTAKIYDTESEYHEVDVTITSILLRPLSAEIKIDNYKDTFRLAGFAELKVVMKDGSTVEIIIRSGGNGENEYTMKAPVILSEVDYVLLPDGTKLPMPELPTE